MARLDPHSFNDSTHPEAERLDWQARVEFKTRTLSATATLHLRQVSEGRMDLDTRGLHIERVQTPAGAEIPWKLLDTDPVLGTPLSLTLPPGTAAVQIRYRTSPDASALQWLEPAQTAGGKHPYLFSQCQAIHARSVVPVQDTPRVRLTWRAEVQVPRELRAVMAARWVNRAEEGPWATERYEMPQPIPPYLFAFAIGDLASRELGPRSRVWAEPSEVDRSAHEFGHVDAMLRAAEQLFGPYDWERFDLLTMPPSFPYGGMENPRLTFLTPTILAGDRSLANVVAHELAHSWTGNLITNASAEHFWLNEGFTVYAERRILEVLEGREVSELHAALGRRALQEAIDQFKDRPELTKLRTHLDGVDPDDAYSQVPYEKGYLFLRALEEAAGREVFDRFIHAYVSTFRFQSLTTEQFLTFAARALPGALEKVGVDDWVDGPGLPKNAPLARSSLLEEVERTGPMLPDPDRAVRWTPAQWQLYLETLPRPMPSDLAVRLERTFNLSQSTNMEILVAWLDAAADVSAEITAGRPTDAGTDVTARIEEVLGRVGRMKYLKPLYAALARRPETKTRARQVFERNQERYHPIARMVVESLLARHGA